MKINNLINSPTSSYGWASFVTVITATSADPTIGGGTTQQSYYLQEGRYLFIIFTLNNNASTSTAGNGTYLFSIPSGFIIDTSIVSASFQSVVGAGFVGSVGVGVAQVYDSTRYFIRAWAPSPNSSMVLAGSTFYTLNTTTNYSANIRVPILY